MKIILYLYYFFRSVFLRGLLNTLALLRAEVTQEKKFGIRTSMIKKSDSKEYFHYQGAGYKVLLRIFSEIAKGTTSFEFVDIGCGKGRAVFVAEFCGYSQLTGIELDPELVKEALGNKTRYVPRNKDSHIAFIQANALDYAYKNKPTVYFLFNPFNEAVLAKVLEKIKAASTAETWFIYMNPLYPKPFEREGMPLVRTFKTRFYTEALVFKMEAHINS